LESGGDEVIAQALARHELCPLRRGDLDLFASARIASLGGGAVGNREGSKPDEANLTTPLQCVGDRLENSVNNFASLLLSYIGPSQHRLNNFIFLHEHASMTAVVI
jgi:hypothetical protein